MRDALLELDGDEAVACGRLRSDARRTTRSAKRRSVTPAARPRPTRLFCSCLWRHCGAFGTRRTRASPTPSGSDTI